MSGPTRAQMRVFVLIDNTMPIHSEPGPTVRRMQSRGWLDGGKITPSGYAVFDKYRANGMPQVPTNAGDKP